MLRPGTLELVSKIMETRFPSEAAVNQWRIPTVKWGGTGRGTFQRPVIHPCLSLAAGVAVRGSSRSSSPGTGETG